MPHHDHTHVLRPILRMCLIATCFFLRLYQKYSHHVSPLPSETEPHGYSYQSFSSLLPCIACCLALSASANPPAILPLLSLAPVSLALPEYPLSLLSGTGLRAAGRLAGGAGGFGFPFAGRAGAGGGGGGAVLTTCSSR